MCYIFNCFGWALDMLQRVITFFLACLLSGVVCLGLAVAIAAGVAYGYNYSMAEFLTFTRSDVTVYMRRGQFYDRPDIDLDREMFARRSNDADGPDNALNLNKTIDYQDQNPKPEAKALPDVWKQVKDTRKYAEVLTKYSPQKVVDAGAQENAPIQPAVIQISRPISVTLNPLQHTTVLQSGTSKIIMRNFQPLDVTKHEDTTPDKANEDFFYQDVEDSKLKKMDYADEEQRKTGTPDIKIRFQDSPPKPIYIPIGMRQWRTTEKTIFPDYTEVDEENVVYKPV